MGVYGVVTTALLGVSLAAVAVLAVRLRQIGREVAASANELRLAAERQRRVVGRMAEWADPSAPAGRN